MTLLLYPCLRKLYFYLKIQHEFKGIEVPNDAIFGALEKGHELPADDKLVDFPLF